MLVNFNYKCEDHSLSSNSYRKNHYFQFQLDLYFQLKTSLLNFCLGFLVLDDYSAGFVVVVDAAVEVLVVVAVIGVVWVAFVVVVVVSGW